VVITVVEREQFCVVNTVQLLQKAVLGGYYGG